MKRRIPLDRLEGAVILLVALIPFLSMDAFLHRRTQASIAGLSSHLASHACVVRDGAETLVDATAVVAGELVLLQAGEFLPADGMLVQADNLHQRPPHAGDWLIAAAGSLLAALLPALGPLSRGFRR